jgi:hypothetical protein
MSQAVVTTIFVNPSALICDLARQPHQPNGGPLQLNATCVDMPARQRIGSHLLQVAYALFELENREAD